MEKKSLLLIVLVLFPMMLCAQGMSDKELAKKAKAGNVDCYVELVKDLYVKEKGSSAI